MDELTIAGILILVVALCLLAVGQRLKRTNIGALLTRVSRSMTIYVLAMVVWYLAFHNAEAAYTFAMIAMWGYGILEFFNYIRRR